MTKRKERPWTRARHALGRAVDCARRARAGTLIRIPMDLITDEHGFSLAPEGWNYYRALVAEYESNPDITLEETTFFRFFQQEPTRAVSCLDDLLFFHDAGRRSPGNDPEFHLGTYPWGGWTEAECRVGGIPFGRHHDEVEGTNTRERWEYGRNPWYDPSDPYPLEVDWKLTTSLYHVLKKGYRPFFHGYPDVTLLLRSNGERRAVMGEGHHRLAIMSHLRKRTVTVDLPAGGIRRIEEDGVDDWYHVKNGRCSRTRALEIFHAFFDLNGRERIEHLGLPPVY